MIFIRRVIVLGILSILLGCAAGAQPKVPSFKVVSPGLEYRQVDLTAPRPIRMHQLRCDPKKVRFHLLMASDLKGKKSKTATAEEMRKGLNQLAVINSSYFGHQKEILGYSERYGKHLNSQLTNGGVFTGFFYWDGGRAGLKQSAESRPKGVPVLFECGPRLVWNGAEIQGLGKNSLANRSGVAIDKQGRVILFALGSTSVTTLAELPTLLMKSVAQGGVDAERALNFDGGSSTQFSLKAGKEQTLLPGRVQVPVFLGVSKR